MVGARICLTLPWTSGNSEAYLQLIVKTFEFSSYNLKCINEICDISKLFTIILEYSLNKIVIFCLDKLSCIDSFSREALNVLRYLQKY